MSASWVSSSRRSFVSSQSPESHRELGRVIAPAQPHTAMQRIVRPFAKLAPVISLFGCGQTRSALSESRPDERSESCADQEPTACLSHLPGDAGSNVGAEVAADASQSFAPQLDASAAEAHSATVPGAPVTGGSDSETLDSGLPQDAPACDMPFEVELSPNISTVVLLRWADTEGWSDASFEYWRNDETPQKSPIKLNSSEPTTVMGLVPDSVYEYRVSARRSGTWCSSIRSEIRTGSAPELLPLPLVSIDVPDVESGGYLLTTPESNDPAASGFVAIYDSVGRPVWWHQTSLSGLLSRAHFSWDGREVWVRDANPLGRATGGVVRVAIDGSKEEFVDMDLGHHDFAPVPDGFLFLVGGGEDTCDIIKHRSTDGEVTSFYSLRDAFGATFRPGDLNACHCNAIDYNPGDESISVSCLNQNAFVKISSHGELVWVLGGNNGQSHFTGDVNWDRQHGHHMIDPTRIVFFNNIGGGDSTHTGSLAVELQLDLEAKTASRVWEYTGNVDSAILGDAQYLANGNLLVTYSTAGELHEVNRAGQRVRSWRFPDGVGYSQHYEDLQRLDDHNSPREMD